MFGVFEAAPFNRRMCAMASDLDKVFPFEKLLTIYTTEDCRKFVSLPEKLSTKNRWYCIQSDSNISGLSNIYQDMDQTLSPLFTAYSRIFYAFDRCEAQIWKEMKQKLLLEYHPDKIREGNQLFLFRNGHLHFPAPVILVNRKAAALQAFFLRQRQDVKYY